VTHPNPEVSARKVLAKITSYDQWFAKPGVSIVAAWAKQIAATNLTDEELLDGVDEVYRIKEGGFRPLPADVLNAARRLRKERFDALPMAEQEAIRDAERLAIDANLAEVEEATPLPMLAHQIPDNPAKGPRWVRCDYCGANAGDRCYNKGRPELILAGYHPARHEVCNPAPAPDDAATGQQDVINRYMGKASGGGA
jgi:hypothetical protein